MYALSAVVLLAAFAASNAGLLAPAATVLAAPSARSAVIGPDGSAIISAAPGVASLVASPLAAPWAGAVATPLAAPWAAAVAAPWAGAIATPLAAPWALAAPGAVASAPAVISGPSGTVVAGRSISAPGLLLRR